MKNKFGTKRKLAVCESQTNPKPNQLKDIWGMVNFLLSRHNGEDDETLQGYIQKLKDQKRLTSGKRNVQLVQLAMEKTYPERRELLIVSLRKISEILDIYPMLTEGEQVIF